MGLFLVSTAYVGDRDGGGQAATRSSVAIVLWYRHKSSLKSVFVNFVACAPFCQVTKECLDLAIGVCGPGRDFRDIGRAIK